MIKANQKLPKNEEGAQMIYNKYEEIFGEKRPSSMYEKTIRTQKYWTEEDAVRMNSKWNAGIKEGESYTQILPPTTIEEGWERLVRFYAQFELEGYMVRFISKFPNPTKGIYEEELSAINNFIANAEKGNINAAFDGRAWKPEDKLKQEYLRIKNNYYSSHLCKAQGYGSAVAQVYGKYFLFKEWIEKKLGDIETTLHTDNKSFKTPVENSDVSPGNKESIQNPTTFQEIFKGPDWKPYIDALYQVEEPVINSNYEFIGNPHGDKGVVGQWIWELRKNGLIEKKFNRHILVPVLNNEIKGLDLKEDGKTISNQSNKYEYDYRERLLKRVNLLP